MFQTPTKTPKVPLSALWDIQIMNLLGESLGAWVLSTQVACRTPRASRESLQPELGVAPHGFPEPMVFPAALGRDQGHGRTQWV